VSKKEAPEQVFCTQEAKQNKSAYDTKESIYKPQVALYQQMKKDSRELEWYLTVQCSIPKLLFGESIRELVESDFERVCTELQNKLYIMGIQILIPHLENSILGKVHIGKNILIPKEYSVAEAITLLSKTTTQRKALYRETHYENSGEALHLYTSSHGIIFYDKLKDLERTKNTAIDKSRTRKEQEIGTTLFKEQKQILRFEIRYNGGQTVTAKLKQWSEGTKEKIRLKDIFKKGVWRDVLTSEWEQIIQSEASQLALRFETAPEEALKALLSYHSAKDKNIYTLTKTLKQYGTYRAIQDMGVTAFRKMFEQQFSHKTVRTRLDHDIAKIEMITKDIPIHPIIADIDAQIRKCTPLTHLDY
jgi:predicted HNH restriction endonuclease